MGIFIVLFLFALLSLVAALILRTEVTLPRLTGATSIYSHVLAPANLTLFRSGAVRGLERDTKALKNLGVSQTVPENTVPGALSGSDSVVRKEAPPLAVKEGPIRAGCFVNWDDHSLISLKRNIGKMTAVFPEWLFLGGTPGELEVAINADALSIMRKSNRAVLPILSNLFDGTVRRDLAVEVLSNEETRRHLIDQLREFLEDEGNSDFSGLLIDIEGLGEEEAPLLSRFVVELKEALAGKQKSLVVAVEPENPAYDIIHLAAASDFLLLKAFNAHYTLTQPGPPAPAHWVGENIDALRNLIPAQKIIVGLGAFGYDWMQNDVGTEVDFQDAMVRARDVGAVPDFDPENSSLTYQYDDENGMPHELWVPDAATIFNSSIVSESRGVAGTALWRLGAEDPRVWDFYERPLSAAALEASPIEAAQLEHLRLATDIEIDGVGEILEVTSSPEEGLVTVSLDLQSNLVTEEAFEKLPSSYHVRRFGAAEKTVVLTFDDGPNAEYTPEILDILKKEQISATFFVIGLAAQANLPILRRIYDEGHSIGNHTFSHPNLSHISDERVKLELSATRRIIEAITGHSTILFRPPYNADNEPETAEELAPVALAKTMNYLMVGESIDTRDWEESSTADEIVARALAELNFGSIILMHDSGGDRSETIKALPKLIAELKTRGYRFATVAELMGKSQDEVMPALKKPLDRLLAHLNWFVAQALFFASKVIAALFVSCIFLTVARMVCVAAVGVVHFFKRTRGEKTGIGTEAAVTVLVPAYNEAVTIVRTVHSLLRSNYKNLSVIVINDGSTDRTAQIAGEAFVDEPRVQVISKENGGKASALNRGISEATGEFLVCVDADTQLEPQAISELLMLFSSEDIGAVAGNVRVGNATAFLPTCQSVEYVVSQNFDRRTYDTLGCITVVPGAIGAYRARLVKELGGFSSDTVAEDCDLTLRIQKAGYRITYAPDAVAWTEAPETVRMFLKQRFRWSFGTLQNVWKHRDVFLRPKHGSLGFIALPNILLFQVFLPLFGPLIDLLAILSIVSGQFSDVLIYYAIFTAVEILAAVLAFAIEGEVSWAVATLPLQRFLYRQLLYITAVRSVFAAIQGTMVGWGAQRRRGTAKLGGKA